MMWSRVLPGCVAVATALTFPELSLGAGELGGDDRFEDPSAQPRQTGTRAGKRATGAPMAPSSDARFAPLLDFDGTSALQVLALPTAPALVAAPATGTLPPISLPVDEPPAQVSSAPAVLAVDPAGLHTGVLIAAALAVDPPAALAASPAPTLALASTSPDPAADVPAAFATAAAGSPSADLLAQLPGTLSADARFAALPVEEQAALRLPAAAAALAPIAEPAIPVTSSALAPVAASSPASAMSADTSSSMEQLTTALIAPRATVPPAVAPSAAITTSAFGTEIGAAPAAAARPAPVMPATPAARSPASLPAPSVASAAVVPAPKPPLTTPVVGSRRDFQIDIKSQLATRVDGKAAGAVDFAQTATGLKVRLGSIVELLGARYDPAQLARIRASSAGNLYLSLSELQGQGIPISYDPVYDEFNVGLIDTRPKGARKVHIDQISTAERGLGSAAIDQVRR
jgi:hypothetical protein